MFTFYTRGNGGSETCTGPRGGWSRPRLGDVAREHVGKGAGTGPGGRRNPGGGVEARARSRARGRQAGGHYLLRGVPLRRRRVRPGPGPRGAGSGSRAAGKDPRAPQTNRGSRWPGRSQWNVAWCVPQRGPGPELPGPPGPSLAPRSPPPAPHGPRRRHLAQRSPEAPRTPSQRTPGEAVRSAPDQKRMFSRDRSGSRAHGPGQATARRMVEGADCPA